VSQALNDPHTQARKMVETVAHPTIGELKMVGIPFKFSDTPASVRRAPPTLGQHTDDIFAARDWAGLKRRSRPCDKTRWSSTFLLKNGQTRERRNQSANFGLFY